MFEKEAEEEINKEHWNYSIFKDLAREYWQKGAEFGYNKALEDIMSKVKTHGLISTELGYSDVFDYENNRISEDVLWDRFEDNAQRELSMIITDIRIKDIKEK